MADDIAVTPGSGATVATDEVSSRHYQLIKPAFGADGSATLVASDAGMPVQGGYKEVSGSATANNTDLVNTDLSAYRWVSVQISGTFSATVTFQVSNDGTTWYSCILTPANSPNLSQFASASSAGLYTGPLLGRYFRARTTAYTSGTVSTVVGAFVNLGVPPSLPVAGSNLTVSISGSASNGSDGTSPFVTAGQYGFNASSWDRLRTPTTFKTLAATTSGNTSLWAPGASNRWRLQRVKFDLTGDAAISSGGVLTMELRDGTTNSINVTQSAYVPGTGGTALGGWTSGWIDLGNGIRSAADNQDLNLNLSATLTAGTCRVIACGTQGIGTAT